MCGQRGAGDWLGALPSKGLGLHLRKAEFCMAGRYRLGMPVFSSEGLCPAPRCPREADKLGDHSLSCAIGGERIARHNHVRQVLYETARQAKLAPVKELAGLLPNSDNRLADVFLPHLFKNGDLHC